MAPASCFDERLEEDPRVNRLEDSLTLWRSICSSKLLARTQLVVFLNKCDLLKRKLKRGIKVKTHLPSYGDRPNEVIAVVKCHSESFHSNVTVTDSILPDRFAGKVQGHSEASFPGATFLLHLPYHCHCTFWVQYIHSESVNSWITFRILMRPPKHLN